MMKYQDMHLTDVELNTQFRAYMANGQYEAALTVLQNDQLTDKMIIAELFNYVASQLISVQSTSDATFKADKIQVVSEPPTDIKQDEVYFKLKG